MKKKCKTCAYMEGAFCTKLKSLLLNATGPYSECGPDRDLWQEVKTDPIEELEDVQVPEPAAEPITEPIDEKPTIPLWTEMTADERLVAVRLQLSMGRTNKEIAKHFQSSPSAIDRVRAKLKKANANN